MAKVLKTIGAIVGIAALAFTGIGLAVGLPLAGAAAFGFGVSASTLFLVSGGLMLGASILSGNKSPQTSPSDRDRLFANIDPRTPRKQIFGATAMATDIRDQEFTGSNQEYFHRFLVVASHKVQSIDSIYFDDKLAWTSGGGVQGEFVGYLTVAAILEGNAGNAINISGRMGSTRRYTGLAYVHFRYKLTGNSKKSESPFSSNVPTRVTIVGKGRLCYDPRLDTTVGGSGSHRADDQSTWGWDDSYCRNPPIQMLNYLLGWRINGILAVGKGIPPARLDMQSFIDAANICDETVSLSGGGTEPRYRSDGIFSEGDDMGLVLDSFKSAMNAVVDDSDGRIKVKVLVDDTADVIASFTADNVLGEVRWKPHADVSERINVVRGTFTDPSVNSLYQAVDYPQVEVASVDDIERAFPLNLPLVQSPTQAQRLATLRLKRAQYAGFLECVMDHEAWKVQKYDNIELSFPSLGFTDKLFRVIGITVNTDGTVPMVLRVEDPAIYAWDEDEDDVVDPVPTTPWVPGNNPFIPTRGAFRLISQSDPFPITTTGDEADIAAFTGVIDDGRTISFPADTITGLSNSTKYGVFMDLSDNSYSATPYPSDAEMATEGLVFVSWNSTHDGAGVYPTEPTPPGGWGGTGPEAVVNV